MSADLVDQLELGSRRRPNPFQRLVRRVAATRVGAWSLSKSLWRIDAAVLALTSGRRTFTSYAAGLPAVGLTTTGARTGKQRHATVLGIPFRGDLAVVGGNFGQGGAPAWTRNLAAHPEAVVAHRRRSVAVRARAVTGAEAVEAMAAATNVYPPYAAYARWVAARGVPLLVLRPALAAPLPAPLPAPAKTTEVTPRAVQGPYVRPNPLLSRVVNPIVVRLGVGTRLVVRGRTSGRGITVPMGAPLELDGRRYLASGRGSTHWVRNLRAAGEAELRVGHRSERIPADEVAGAERDCVLAAYRERHGRSVDGLWATIPDSADHPVFRIEPAG
jgi:deazaflavin-dependent oxidoreductase (nitroreductase family)